MNENMILYMGVAVAFNLLIILWKFQHDRIGDGTLDSALLVLVGVVFSGTITGLMIGTIASAIVSLYLLAFPPKQFDLSSFE